MHIVFLTHEYPKEGLPHGGVGTFTQNISRWLVREGHDVSIIGANYSAVYEEELDLGVKIYRLPRYKVRGLTWLLSSRAVSKKISVLNEIQRIDIVEGTELAFAFLNKLNSIKYVIRLHGGHHFFADAEKRKVNYWKGLQEKVSFWKTDVVVGVSQYSVNHTSKFLEFRDKLHGVIHTPLDLDKFYLSESHKQTKGRIFFIGTVCEKKGIRQLIEAMPLVRKVIPEAHLVVAGRDWFFPGNGESYIEYLKNFIDKDSREFIEFIGPVPNNEIPKLIELSQVCCYPSHMETFGIVAIEAMAMGKPVIFTELGPGPEVIDDGKTGLLCNPYSNVDIANKIIWLIQNTDEATEIGVRARQEVISKYSLDFIGVQNLNLYKSII